VDFRVCSDTTEKKINSTVFWGIEVTTAVALLTESTVSSKARKSISVFNIPSHCNIIL
jgi:hypothetical protein